MCKTLSRRLIPILALVAVPIGGVAARADDGRPGAVLAPPPVAQTREAASAPRIYVPLHPAQPREIEEEFAPLQTTTFGARPNRAGRAAAAPHGDGAAKTAAPGSHTAPGTAPDTQSAQVPDGR